jgi:predicted nucleic acid-binding protein
MTELPTRSIYLDANTFIYAVEGDDRIALSLRALFSRFGPGRCAAVTSELTLAEVLPRAAERHRNAYVELLLRSGIFELKAVTRDILMETSDYRRGAASTLPDGRNIMPKLPDAIHVVTAAQSGCSLMLSGDIRLKLPAEMRLVPSTLSAIHELADELA